MREVSKIAIREIAKEYGVDASELKYLSGGHEWSDGILYEYIQEEKEKVLKFMAMKVPDTDSIKAMVEKLKFVRFLGENGVNIVYPTLSQNENIFEQYRDNESINVGYSMDKLQGRHIWDLREDEFPGFITNWGKVIGQLHACTKKYPDWRHSLQINAAGKPLICWQNEMEFFEGWCKEGEVRQAWREIRAELEKLPVDRDSFGFIHNDPHAGNLIIGDDKLTMLDFDVANYHWFMTDIAIALYAAIASTSGGFEKPLKNPDYPKWFMDLFMKGYSAENHIDDEWLKKIELFLSYRRILLYIVNYEGLSKEPEFLKMVTKRIVEQAPILTYAE